MTTTRHDDSQTVDRSAFQRRFGPHHAVALALATRLMGSREDAEDAVQDALMKLWRTRDTLPQVEDQRAWFLRVVFNRCMDARRRRAARAGHEAAAPAAEPGAHPGATPVSRNAPVAEGSAQRDLLRRVREVMGELPPKQQAVLHLRVFEEMSYDDIAAALDLTPRSARVYLVKARAHLRGRLGGELSER